eukprot:1160457-Pelagomonas_calceolata.AAC.3
MVVIYAAQGIGGTGQGFDGPSAGRLGSYGFIPQHNPPPEQLRSAVAKVWTSCSAPMLSIRRTLKGQMRTLLTRKTHALHGSSLQGQMRTWLTRKTHALHGSSLQGQMRTWLTRKTHALHGSLPPVREHGSLALNPQKCHTPCPFDAHRRQRTVQRSNASCLMGPASWAAATQLPVSPPPWLLQLLPCAGVPIVAATV